MRRTKHAPAAFDGADTVDPHSTDAVGDHPASILHTSPGSTVTPDPAVVRLEYRDLVDRLTDLSRLATPPVPGERTGTFTSFDRSSVYDQDTDTYRDWGANADGSGFIRRTEDGVVVFDADGPGVIWRVWSALPDAGHLRIYIDGAAEPVYDRPFRDFFDSFSDERCPANFPELTPTLSRGRNSWIPIPYQQHCTIVLAEGWGAYYHFSYSTFPASWRVPSFDATFSPDAAMALAEADRALSRRGRLRSESEPLTSSALAEPGAVTTVLERAGSGAVTDLRLRLPGGASLPEAEERELLRRLTIRITWDGADHPAVWAPIGDFFGGAPWCSALRDATARGGPT